MDESRLKARTEDAVRHFWTVRKRQQEAQGRKTGTKDAGSRSAVTGGAQFNGFITLVGELIAEAGVHKPCIFADGRYSTYVPGYYRPTKDWDLLVVANGHLLACLEFKSQVGSFGNNFNNRTEEAIGSASDFWTAYREGAFAPSPRPWLGYFMLLEDAKGSTSPVAVQEPHFPVFPEFKEASYARRYEILCAKLVRERLYDGACLIMSRKSTGLGGEYREPNTEVGVLRFSRSIVAHMGAHAPQVNEQPGPAAEACGDGQLRTDGNANDEG